MTEIRAKPFVMAADLFLKRFLDKSLLLRYVLDVPRSYFFEGDL